MKFPTGREVGARIRQARDEQHMSAQTLSDRCAGLGVNVPRPSIAGLENGGRTEPRVREVLAIAMVLDLHPMWLIEGPGWTSRSFAHGRRLGRAEAVAALTEWEASDG